MTYRDLLIDLLAGPVAGPQTVEIDLADGFPTLAPIRESFDRLMEILRGGTEPADEGEQLRKWGRETAEDEFGEIREIGFHDQLAEVVRRLAAGENPPAVCLLNPIDVVEGIPARRLLWQASIVGDRLDLTAFVARADAVAELAADVADFSWLATLLAAAAGCRAGRVSVVTLAATLGDRSAASLEVTAPRPTVSLSVAVGRGLESLLAVEWADVTISEASSAFVPSA